MAENIDPSARIEPFLNIAGRRRPKQDPGTTDNGGNDMSDNEPPIAGRRPTATTTTTISTRRPTTRTPKPKTTPKIETTTPTTTTTTTTMGPDDEDVEENSGEGGDPGNAEADGQTSATCKTISGQHGSFIKENLEMMQKKCAEYHACTVELYKSENIHRILVGENIQLRNICGLLYPNASGQYKTLENQCSVEERDSIKQQLGEELTNHLGEQPTSSNSKAGWEKLTTCLNKENPNGDDSDMDRLCRLKGPTSRPLCNSTEINRTAEDFFNLKLKELHCSCNAVIAESKQVKSFPLGAVIGGTCTFSVVLLLIIIVVVLCIRHRRLKRRLTAETKRSGNMPLPDESFPIYQELGDPYQGPDDWRKWGNPGYRLAHRPPTLPYRYVPNPIPTNTSPNDHDYLEPLPDASHLQPGMTLPGFMGQGPGQYDLAKQVEPSPDTTRKTVADSIKAGGSRPPPEEGTYFEKINWQSVKDSEEDGGYSTLGRKPTLKVRGTPEVSGEELQPLNSQSAGGEEGDGQAPGRVSSADPAYFVLEPTLSMTTQV